MFRSRARTPILVATHYRADGKSDADDDDGEDDEEDPGDDEEDQEGDEEEEDDEEAEEDDEDDRKDTAGKSALPRHRGMLGRQTRPMSISRTMARALPARTREVTAPASYATIVAARLSR
jgi:hypothetical protein